MTVIQSGVDTTLAEVDDTHKALPIISKSVEAINFCGASATTCSFERLRTSHLNNVFEYTFGALTPTLATNIFQVAAFGAGTETLTTNLYGIDLNTTTATGTGRWIQSFYHTQIITGISTVLRFTFNFNKNIVNLRQRVGMFTDQGTFPSTAGDGAYLENDGGTLSVVTRYLTQGTIGTEERVNQSSWNLDKLDGTGLSGYKIDVTKAQHLVIEYQPVGTIRFGFETGHNGIVWVHEFISVNNVVEAKSSVFSLPIRAECYSYGTVAIPGKLTLFNAVIQQEGVVLNRPWKYFGASTNAIKTIGTNANTLYPLMSIRPAQTNGTTKRTTVVPVSIDITITTAVPAATSLQVALLMLPTPNTGATFAVNTPGSNTTVDRAVTSTTAVTGTAIWTSTLPSIVGRYSFDLSDMSKENMNKIGYVANGGVTITGNPILTLALGNLTGNPASGTQAVASINWKEQ